MGKGRSGYGLPLLKEVGALQKIHRGGTGREIRRPETFWDHCFRDGGRRVPSRGADLAKGREMTSVTKKAVFLACSTGAHGKGRRHVIVEEGGWGNGSHEAKATFSIHRGEASLGKKKTCPR